MYNFYTTFGSMQEPRGFQGRVLMKLLIGVQKDSEMYLLYKYVIQIMVQNRTEEVKIIAIAEVIFGVLFHSVTIMEKKIYEGHFPLTKGI